MPSNAAFRFSDDDVLTERSPSVWFTNAEDASEFAAQAAWWQGVRRQLERLQKLEENWDSYGAQPVSGVALNVSVDLLKHFGPRFEPPRIAPLPNGGLQLEWESPDYEVSVEISPTRRVSLLVESPAGLVDAEETGSPFGQFLNEYASRLANRIPRRESQTA